MILQDLGRGYGAVKRADYIKEFSYIGVGDLDELSDFDSSVLGNFEKLPSSLFELNVQHRFNRAYINTCFATATYFFNQFSEDSNNFRKGAVLYFQGETLGVAKNYSEVNFLALRSFYQRSSLNSHIHFPLIKGVAYSVDLDTRAVFREVMKNKAEDSWGHIDIADLKTPITLIPSRVLLAHELILPKNLYGFENNIEHEFPFLPDNSLIHDYMRK